MTDIEYYKSIDSPTLSNAIELLKVRPNERGFTPLEIRSLFPEFGRMCGYAVTAQVETVTETQPFTIDTFIELYKAVEAAPKPAVIVFQEIGAFGNYAAHCGEIMATFFTRLGAVGLVTDCGVRDLPEVRALGFQYFAQGSVASHANFRVVRTGVPVQVCGMVVRPHDLIHGDENGILTVPNVERKEIEERVELISVPNVERKEIEERVELIRRRERAVMDYVRGSEFSLDGFRNLVVE